jgi:hypothetical protein
VIRCLVNRGDAVPVQAPRDVLLVRPHHFRPNPQTAADNAFQSAAGSTDLAERAFHAVTTLALRLRAAGVRAHVFDDPERHRPDSVFPNNWLSTHACGRVAVYPMYAPNRRAERRSDVLAFLRSRYTVDELVDYSAAEREGRFLEGTGAMVLDHVGSVAYAARSRRVDPGLFAQFCDAFGYEPVLFDAVDPSGRPIYHTNVMMSVGTDFAMVGLDTVPDPATRERITARLETTGRRVIALSHAQVAHFAGNAIELDAGSHRVLALSARAAASLTLDQRSIIEQHCDLLPIDVAPIELAGGSVRCMIAGIHLQPRSQAESLAPEGLEAA